MQKLTLAALLALAAALAITSARTRGERASKDVFGALDQYQPFSSHP
jgi:hypothetical protein